MIVTLAFILALKVICEVESCDVICKFDDFSNTTDCSSMGLTCFPEVDVRTRIIVLDDNLIQSITEDAFDRLINLRVLHMKRNLLDNLGIALFAQANQLVEINLNGNYISEISTTAFEGLSELKLLDLSNNRLRNLPNIKELVSLETLLLENNLFVLTPELNLPKLTSLSLRYNLISHVISDNFKGVPSLVNLDISTNVLGAFIAEDASTSFLNIKKLDVSHNVLTTFHLDTNSTVEILDISYNRLSGLVVKAKALRTAILEGNLIVKLEDISITTESRGGGGGDDSNGHVEVDLTKVLLNYNIIEAIKQSSFQGIMAEVDVISLNHNRVSHIAPFAFSNLNRIEVIYLNSNTIQDIQDGAFAQLPHLKTIDLSGNFIHTLGTYAFSNLPELTKVSIGGNYESRWLSNFSVAFNGSDFISVVDISNNKIHEIPSDFFEVLGKSLLHLILSDNELVALKTISFLDAEVIEVLDLRRNLIETIDDDFFQNVISLREINMHNNPLLCDCRLKAYHTWLQQINFEDHVLCNGPPELAGFEIINLSNTQLICTLPSLILNDTSIDVLEGLDIVLICETTGIPQPTVSWILPNQTYATNSHKYYVQSDNSLKITDIVWDDEGGYSCVASNFVGTVKETIQMYTIHKKTLVEGIGKTVGLAIGIAVLVQTFFACVFIYYWTSRTVQPRKTNNKLLAKAYPIERVQLHSTKATVSRGVLTTDDYDDNNGALNRHTPVYQEIQSILLTDDSPLEALNGAKEIGQDNSKTNNDQLPNQKTSPDESSKLEQTPLQTNLEGTNVKKSVQNVGGIRSSTNKKEKATGSHRKASTQKRSHEIDNEEKSIGAMFNSSYEQDMTETYF